MTEREELDALLSQHLPPPMRGKVRDNYLLSSTHEGQALRLSVPSNRWSMFDFKMGFPNPGQDEMLNAFDIAAKTLIEEAKIGVETDLVVYGVEIDQYLPEPLRGNKLLQRIAPVTEVLDIYPVECVGRNISTGTFHQAYVEAKGGPVWGHYGILSQQPEGFVLPEPIFTPTTKAADGHDLPLDVAYVQNIYGPEPEELTLKVLQFLTADALLGEVMGVDTKIEIGRRKIPPGIRRLNQHTRGKLLVADELWTPHSSRFWKRAEYLASFPEKIPVSMDKQVGREWGKSEGIHKLDPKNPDHQARVKKMVAPRDVLELMQSRSFEAFEMMHGLSIPQFQRNMLGVAA